MDKQTINGDIEVDYNAKLDQHPQLYLMEIDNFSKLSHDIDKDKIC